MHAVPIDWSASYVRVDTGNPRIAFRNLRE